MGHLHSLVVADIFARYAKLSQPGRPVRFVTGTDEHGMKLQKASRERGMEPLAFCDELSQHFRVGVNLRLREISIHLSAAEPDSESQCRCH